MCKEYHMHVYRDVFKTPSQKLNIETNINIKIVNVLKLVNTIKTL